MDKKVVSFISFTPERENLLPHKKSTNTKHSINLHIEAIDMTIHPSTSPVSESIVRILIFNETGKVSTPVIQNDKLNTRTHYVEYAFCVTDGESRT